MPPQPPSVEALRLTLHKLEQEEATYTPEDFAELKGILLNRIAVLELAEAVAANPPPADLAPTTQPLTEVLAAHPPPAEPAPLTKPATASMPPTLPEVNPSEALDPATDPKKLD